MAVGRRRRHGGPARRFSLRRRPAQRRPIARAEVIKLVDQFAQCLPISLEPGHAGVGHRAALDELHKAGELLLIAQAHVINKTAAQVP
ncbi:MAG: hypothetical protein EBQ71_16905 [Betaproteobacteria bacterium]|nr:hypothetical protein [Betaproteobacteria bacterium]